MRQLGVLAIVATLAGVRYLQTPSESWMELTASEDRDITKAVVVTTNDNREVVRSLSRWRIYHGDDEANPAGMVSEFDRMGNRTGEFRYQLDAGGEGDIYRDYDTTKWGSLADDIRAGKVDTIADMELPGLLYNYGKADRCEIAEDSLIQNSGVTVAMVPIAKFEADAEQAALQYGLTKANILWKPVFFQAQGALLSFSYVSKDKGWCTLPRISYDSGRTWKNGKLLDMVSPLDLNAVAVSGERKIVYIAFEGVRDNAEGNAIYRSEDGGLSWKPVPLPKEAKNHEDLLLTDIATSMLRRELVAVSLGKAVNEAKKDIVMYSTDGGKNWRTLDYAVPKTGDVRLGGVTKDGSVVALFGKRLYLWRKLSFRERGRLMFEPVKK